MPWNFIYKALQRVKLNRKLIICRLTTCLLFFACVQAAAKGVAQKVSINENNVSLEIILKKIEVQTGYTFLYEKDVIEKASLISLHVDKAPLDQVLTMCFKGQPLTYKIFDSIIVIKENIVQYVVKKEDSSVSLANIVNGKVTNESGEPMQGVSVTVKASNIGTSTDTKGSYSIDVPGNGTLVFSYVGFETMETAVANRSTISVQLKQSIAVGEEAVVIGYGTLKKRDLTGSVSSVKAKLIENERPQSVQDILKGNVSGLETGTSMTAKGGGSLEIRGNNTLKTSSAPLIVLDGVIYPGGMEDINPYDIETIDVLKDASSAAVFGSRASNGVIMITTKKGSLGKPIINVTGSTGIATTAKMARFTMQMVFCPGARMY
ncbi:MAG: TonB-dependent receptor plug domain-containing protein [Chitinophagaceae bacterium]